MAKHNKNLPKADPTPATEEVVSQKDADEVLKDDEAKTCATINGTAKQLEGLTNYTEEECAGLIRALLDFDGSMAEFIKQGPKALTCPGCMRRFEIVDPVEEDEEEDEEEGDEDGV